MSCVIIYPMELSPVPLSDPPENMTGSHIRFLFGLASDGVYMAFSVTRETVVSYTAFPPLPGKTLAVSLCCTIPGVTSAGRYPASCPAKPGLSSPGPFRSCQPRLHILLCQKRNIRQLIIISQTFSVVHPPKSQIPQSSLSYIKTASPHKLPQNRILGNILNRHSDKIIQKLQQPLCLLVLRLSLLNLEQQRFRIQLQNRKLIHQR